MFQFPNGGYQSPATTTGSVTLTPGLSAAFPELYQYTDRQYDNHSLNHRGVAK